MTMKKLLQSEAGIEKHAGVSVKVRARKGNRRTRIRTEEELGMTPTKKTRIATVKALVQSGVSNRMIAHSLKMSKDTVSKYRNMQDEQVDAMKEVIMKHWLIKDFTIGNKAYDRIDTRLDRDEVNTRDLIGLWKIARDNQRNDRGTAGTGTTVNIQVNATSGNVGLEEQ